MINKLTIIILVISTVNYLYNLNRLDDNDKTYLMFVQVWPPAWLLNKNVSYDFTNDYFTIHGIWPDYYNGSYPQFCNKSEKFDVNKLEPIKKDLVEYWTDFTNPENLWKHEFQKHFTCLEIEDAKYRGKELKFFELGLSLRNKYNLFTILDNSNIKPSDEIIYKTNDLLQCLKNSLGVNIIITCESDILTEVRICMDMDNNLINCPTEDGMCTRENIKYPYMNGIKNRTTLKAV